MRIPITIDAKTTLSAPKIIFAWTDAVSREIVTAAIMPIVPCIKSVISTEVNAKVSPRESVVMTVPVRFDAFFHQGFR